MYHFPFKRDENIEPFSQPCIEAVLRDAILKYGVTYLDVNMPMFYSVILTNDHLCAKNQPNLI